MIHGDGIAGMASLEPGSVGLILCDLPSGETAAKFDKKVDLPEFWAAAWHCLAPTGNIVLMASSFRFAAELLQSQSQFFRYDAIWEKTIATGFLNAKKRPLRAHELVMVFNRGNGATYNVEMIETGKPISKGSRSRAGTGENYGNAGHCAKRTGATNRFPISILRIPSLGNNSKQRAHPQQKPDDLFRRLVRVYSNPGELVADPCAGSGTTERAAMAEGRRDICWEIQERFHVRDSK